MSDATPNPCDGLTCVVAYAIFRTEINTRNRSAMIRLDPLSRHLIFVPLLRVFPKERAADLRPSDAAAAAAVAIVAMTDRRGVARAF
jgi:hypothetical protein